MTEINIEYLVGRAPLQGEGSVGEKRFYFRSRHNEWSLEIGDDPMSDLIEWSHSEPYGDTPFAASHMPEDEARAFILKACGLYLAGAPSGFEAPEGD